MSYGKSFFVGVTALSLFVFTAESAADRTVESWVSSLDMSRTLAAQDKLAFSSAVQGQESDIVVDDSQTYQTILGLGSSLEHSTCANLWRLEPALRSEVMERLVSPGKGIGMNLMRICIGTPDFTGEPWYSYDDMPAGQTDDDLKNFSIEKDRAYVIPVLKLALEKNPDLLFFATPWSPPGWMKTTGDLIGGHLYPKYYPHYARYLARFIEAYQAEGIPIHAVTVQNEPGVNKKDDVESWWYPSCQWSLVVDEDTWWPVPLEIMGHAERDFIRDHLGPTLRQAGIKTQIWCFDHNLNNLWYPRNILSDPAAAEYVEGTAFHPYAGEASDMGAFHNEFPRKDVHLSEGSMYKVEGAVNIIEFLRNWAVSYNAWVTMIDTNGRPNNGPFECTDTCVMLDAQTLAVRYTFDYFMYGQFMKFIQRGAVRIDSGQSAREFAQVAFRNPDTSIVLVAANPTKVPFAFTIGYEDGVLKTELPAESIATYRWRQ